MLVVGVDGCKGGWLAVSYDTIEGTISPKIHSQFEDVIGTYLQAKCIAVDIPIGLSTSDSRECDKVARRELTKLRGSSVFPAPDPRILDAPSHEEASAMSFRLTGKKISIQSFGILPKVAEVNRLMTPELQMRIVEIHPEVCFWALAGKRPMQHAKRDFAGFQERRSLLISEMKIAIPSETEARNWVRGAAADDVLDAIAASWSARRFAEGISKTLPDRPSKDAKGLRMEMVY